MPREEKRRVESIYRRFTKDYLSDHPSQANRYESALNFIWEKYKSHLLPDYVKWMTKLDECRAESFVAVFPEWKELFEQYNPVRATEPALS